MNDEKRVKDLIHRYGNREFRKTVPIHAIENNTLSFIRESKYKKYIEGETGINATVIVPGHFDDYGISDDIKLVFVNDVDYVFGMVHNHIYERSPKPQNYISRNIKHNGIKIEDGIRLFHKPDGTKGHLIHTGGVVIDDGCRIGNNVVIHRATFTLTMIRENVTLGSNVSIGHNNDIGMGTVIAPGTVTGGRVVIGNNCWIGMNCTIKHGISISDNIVVGQASNVIYDLSESGIYAGNPARYIKPLETKKWNF